MSESRGNILIVDDTLKNLQLLVKILSHQGYTVRPAQNGHIALAAIMEGLPDLILLDIVMPDLDGYELCRRLKANPQTEAIPIIFLSALNEVFDKVKAFSMGGVDYITKPFEEEEVLARVETHLTIARLQQQLNTYNQHLESQVADRTRTLEQTLLDLRREIAERQQHQAEKETLFQVVQQQNEHLHALTQGLLNSQQHKQQTWAETIEQEVEANIDLLITNLKLVQYLLASEEDVTAMVSNHVADAQQILQQIKRQMTVVSQDLNASLKSLTNPLTLLTEREAEVLDLLVAGQSTAEIATNLYISQKTVYAHRSNIMSKLEVETIPDLVKLALQFKG